MTDLQNLIAQAWQNRELLKDEIYIEAVKSVVEDVDKGRLRTAFPSENGWIVNE
ncbi:MAG: 2,3,4,5-tetrahydropyridine-2,6-dicarboxylate N-succinyltransferase, partial [Chitinophagaceae bacterium]